MTTRMTAIRTWGEAVRRMAAAAQFWMGVVQRTDSDEVRRYARAMAKRAIELVQEMERKPSRPFGPRQAAIQCAKCGRPVWVSASRLWDASHGGAPLSSARCPDCVAAAAGRAQAERVTAGLTASAAAGPEEVAAVIAKIVELDRDLFDDRWENPENLARAAIGAFEPLAARWQGLQSVLVGCIGEDAARRALWAARREAGTDILVCPPAREPDPVVDEPDRGNSHAVVDASTTPEQCDSQDHAPQPNDVPDAHDDWVI